MHGMENKLKETNNAMIFKCHLLLDHHGAFSNRQSNASFAFFYFNRFLESPFSKFKNGPRLSPFTQFNLNHHQCAVSRKLAGQVKTVPKC